MIFKLLNRTLLLPAGLSVLFFLSASEILANCPGQIKPTSDDPLNMLVLGDSVMWGQGLKIEQKSWWRVKCWLQEKTGREVRERIEAHSGAVIVGASDAPKFKSRDGEVNLPFPSINEQLDHAFEAFGENRAKVNLILLDGCINDVGVTNLLNAAASVEWLHSRIQDRCGNGMSDLLRRVTDGFPNAYILVTGYYHMISRETGDNAFLRMLVKKLVREEREREEKEGKARRMTDQEMRQRLIAISDEWYRQSTLSLTEAVNKTNKELADKSLPPRVAFVEIQFSPEHAFAAPDTLLWNFKFGSTNSSGFRQLISALSLGTAAYKPNDQTRESRARSCKEIFKKAKGVKETKEEKKTREDSYLICRYASLGHPNKMGALLYAEAIKGRLQWFLDKTGWLPTMAPVPASH